MNHGQAEAFEQEIASARALMRRREHLRAMRHLERAHVLGQRHVVPHVWTHWLMLTVAVRRRDPAAMFGQAVRIVLGAVGSLVGPVPTGNTGGTDVSLFARRPIEPGLLALMGDDGWRP
jgi:hypothetical protein